jgi:uncharacterized membrane protein
VLGLALLAFVIPLAAPEGGVPSLWWVGLSRRIPDTLDVRPLFPWTGLILLGVAFGQAGGLTLLPRPGRLHGRPGRAIAAAGRHTLPIYLFHQPVLFAAFSGLAHLWAGSLASPPMRPGFLTECQTACVAKDTDPERCASMCHCVQEDLAAAPASKGRPEELKLFAMSCVRPPR